MNKGVVGIKLPLDRGGCISTILIEEIANIQRKNTKKVGLIFFTTMYYLVLFEFI